jgi:hypothetical protein
LAVEGGGVHTVEKHVQQLAEGHLQQQQQCGQQSMIVCSTSVFCTSLKGPSLTVCNAAAHSTSSCPAGRSKAILCFRCQWPQPACIPSFAC